MLFIQPTSIFFLFSIFSIMMDSLNIDNRSKSLPFKKNKRLLYKHYSKFVKVYKKQPNRLDI